MAPQKYTKKERITRPKNKKYEPYRGNYICRAQQEDCDLLTSVSSAIRRRYGSVETKRVIESLNFLAADEEYYRDHANFGIQRASSYISGLEARPFHDTDSPDFLWMKNLGMIRSHGRVTRSCD